MSAKVKQEPFYFKSYSHTIGVACDLTELEGELRRLAQENPRALEYHLREGHIANWLEALNEKELARQLKGECSIEAAKIKVASHLDRNRKRSRGRASMHVPPHRLQSH